MTRKISNLTYNDTQKLDLYLVEKPGQPLVVCLHGGGFFAGSKTDERCRQSASLLSKVGINCASISYSLASRENRFAMWPRNLFDVADALAFLHDQAEAYNYDFGRFGMLGFSAGCCLSNLYIQGGKDIFDHFAYETPLFIPAALAGFYGPYDFSIRQRERRSDDPEINRFHSPSHWLRQSSTLPATPVLHIQGDRDDVVYPDQHELFHRDYSERGFDFKAVLVGGFGHSFAPVDSNDAGKTIDLRSELTAFFSNHLVD
jgi:acetyl esterase/lipase